MINTLEARYPLAEVIFVPTAVQGDEAIADIVSSVEYLDSRGDIDVIIIGRGGGSLENLWAFNTEEVARAVFRCKTPIISAVGHETDHTVSDEVADCRALTPTAAAVIATPDINEEREHIIAAYEKMKQSLTTLISREENRINNYAEHSPLANINAFFDERIELMNEQKKKLLKSIELLVQRREQSLLASVRELNALSPLAVLSRGYSLTKNENGIVSSTDDVKINDTLEIMVADGKILATANEVIKDEH
jgi:exodeoxyribonuclease VII large subunit